MLSTIQTSEIVKIQKSNIGLSCSWWAVDIVFLHKTLSGVVSEEKINNMGDKGEEEEEKPRGRQSKRNINKIVKYHEFEDDNSGEEDSAAKPRGRQGRRKMDGSDDDDEFITEEGGKRRRGQRGRGSKRKGGEEDLEESGEEDDAKPKAKKVKAEGKMNRTDSDFESIDFSCDKTTADGKPWNLKICGWNIGGLKAWIKKNGLEYIKHEKPDILCLQETRCSESKVPPEAKVEGYHTYWLSGEKEGYAGVALYSKEKPLNVKYGIGNKEFDSEGRLITAEYESFYLVNAYVPNAGRGLVTLPKRMKWDPDLRRYLKELDAKKPVILCGDMNVSHEAIDLANPKSNTKNAGFTQEERDGMTALLKEGFVDTFRHLYPEKTGAYTFWTYMGNARSRNVGWRLDYFIVSERLAPNVCDSVMRPEVYGSDHCPITLFIHI
ncbi:DNA repair nuclease APEX1 isoform X2 [Anabrus simplex]|uniref:DNA repair nuclease APEX1 isoform X2 n=1 Tax=Anabrus simplex TaxID=316456 RepID=UPI0035A3C523